MAERARCELCDRNFKSEESLAQHNSHKHKGEDTKKKASPIFKKIKGWGIFIIVIVFLGWGIMAIIPEDNVKELNVDISTKANDIPPGSVHFHPRITIKIDKNNIMIETDIGSRVGKTVDVHLSGMRMSPTHTHETDGTIHLENSNPSSKPETLTVGYFFYVWDKQFSSSCIFEYCTDKGVLKMTVNGEENFEFENYIMADKDDIVITYTSN